MRLRLPFDDKKIDRGTWSAWFAWRPVWVVDGESIWDFVWLETICRYLISKEHEPVRYVYSWREYENMQIEHRAYGDKCCKP